MVREVLKSLDVFFISVDGDPVPWHPPRFDPRSRRAYHSRGCKLAPWQDLVRMWVRSKAKRNSYETGCETKMGVRAVVTLETAFFIRRRHKYRDFEKSPFPIHRDEPDLTNLHKAVEDAVKGVIFGDDCRVQSCTTSKDYADSTIPGVRIILRRL